MSLHIRDMLRGTVIISQLIFACSFKKGQTTGRPISKAHNTVAGQ